MERKGPPPRSGQTGLSRARYRGPDISVLFASRFTRATAARRFAVLSARFRRLAVLTARGIILAARLSAASLTTAAAS